MGENNHAKRKVIIPALFGSLGEIGRLLVKFALNKGDIVYDYARSQDKIKMQNDHLHIIKGDLTDEKR